MTGFDNPDQSFANLDDGEHCYPSVEAMDHAIEQRQEHQDDASRMQFTGELGHIDWTHGDGFDQLAAAGARLTDAFEHHAADAQHLHARVHVDNMPPVSGVLEPNLTPQTSMSPISAEDEERAKEYTREREEALRHLRGEHHNPVQEQLSHTSPEEIERPEIESEMPGD